MTFSLRKKGFMSFQKCKDFVSWMNRTYPNCGCEYKSGSYYDKDRYYAEWESPR